MDAISDPRIDTVVVMSSAQVGKALAIDTPIATPDGWKAMGDIEPGDFVFGSDGKPTRVNGVSEIMTGRTCYAVRFSDGSSIVADSEHLWTVDSDTAVGTGNRWAGKAQRRAVLTTDQIRKTLRYGNRNRYAVPVCAPLEMPNANLSIDPYLLGAWLGDGHSVSARIFCHGNDSPHWIEQIAAAGHATRVIESGTCNEIVIDPQSSVCIRGHDKDLTGRVKGTNGCAECGRIAAKNFGRVKRGAEKQERPGIVWTFSRLLNRAGLMRNKHIPREYLRASFAQRLALFQGLMDTDGSIGKNGRAEFVSTSDAIANGFAELAASLGLKPTHVVRRAFVRIDGKRVEGAPAHRFSFLAYDDLPIFRLARKRSRMKPSAGGRPSETKRRRIISVQATASVPVRCIRVEAPDHLFLAGREMIPTHNTELVNNLVGFHVAQDPAPVLILMPTLELGEAWSKDRLAPMLRDTPALRGTVKDARSRDSGNTLLHKSFPGGHLTICGANSPASLASRPIRIVACDEVDRYPYSAGTEGDPITLAKKRSATFWNRKLVLTSTPTVKGASRIETAFEASDQRRYWIPCAHCGEMQTLAWSSVKWPPNEPERAALHCVACGVEWTDNERWSAIRRGEWRAAATFTGTAGFHLSELYSPWARIADIARAFVEAKRSPETLKAWTNTSLGETWEEQGEGVDETGLLDRREEWDELPTGALVVTAGVDVQADRLEVELVAWGVDEESWSAAHHRIYGDPSAPAVWADLDRLLTAPVRREDGVELHIAAACVDSGGHHTQQVYQYCTARYRRRIYAIKGMAGSGRMVWPKAASKGTGKHKLFMVGVDAAKEAVYARLKITRPGPGFCHFPADRDADWFAQLTAETVSVRYSKGFPVRVWTKRAGARNEALDCRVYAYAALQSLAVNWGQLARAKFRAAPPKQEAAQIAQPVAQPEPQPQPQQPQRPAFVRPARGGWMGGGGFRGGF